MGLAYSWLKSGATTQMRRTLAFTCKARLNDCPRSGHTYALCLVQGLVVRLARYHGHAFPGIADDNMITAALPRAPFLGALQFANQTRTFCPGRSSLALTYPP